jgi:AcrR family transcriptional regulator
MEGPSFKEQQFKVREDLIVTAANQLLADKGFDLMTMDDVAAAVGVSKGILYKHFASKEGLAAAAMVRVLRGALGAIEALPPDLPALDKLKAALRWTLESRLAGGLPLLPSGSASLQSSLMTSMEYVGAIFRMNAMVTGLVEQAVRAGDLRDDLPVEVMVHSIYSRTCDPALDFLRRGGRYTDADLVAHLVSIAFDGLAKRR